MRVTSSDGLYDNTLWFNGFLAAPCPSFGSVACVDDGTLGWWDFYASDVVVGVVEWDVQPDGGYAAAIASLTGDTNGDMLAHVAYVGNAAGVDAVSYYDASADFVNYVRLLPDQSGVVELSDRNNGAPGCWNTAYQDVPCP